MNTRIAVVLPKWSDLFVMLHGSLQDLMATTRTHDSSIPLGVNLSMSHQGSEKQTVLGSSQDLLAQIAAEKFRVAKQNPTIVGAHTHSLFGVVLFRHFQIHIDFRALRPRKWRKWRPNSSLSQELSMVHVCLDKVYHHVSRVNNANDINEFMISYNLYDIINNLILNIIQ